MNITGGTPPYEVQWSLNGVTATKSNVGNSITIEQLAAGTYTIDVIDANGYSYSLTKKTPTSLNNGLLSIPITQPDSALQITTNINHETCRESNNGTIEVIVTGGTAPYSITWDQSPVEGFKPLMSSESGQFIIEGGAGMYHYLVKDKFNECATIPGPSIEIKEPEVLELQEQLKENATEFRKLDGKYKVHLVGDVNNAVFYDYVSTTNWYKINAGSEVPMDYLTNTYESNNLGAGSYRIRTTSSHTLRGTKIDYDSSSQSTVITYPITTAIACSTFKDFVITEPELLRVIEDVTSHSDVKCYGESTGSIALNITGGTAPYEVRWSLNGITTTKSNVGNSIIIDKLIYGIYAIDVIDANGYSYSLTKNTPTSPNNGVIQIEIKQPDQDRKLFIDRTKVTLTNTSCGLNNGEIILDIPATVAFGPEPYKKLNYFWTGSNSWTSNDRNIKNLASGDYNLTIVDQNGCSITTAPFIVQPSEEVKFEAPEYVILKCKTPTDPAIIAITNITGTGVNGQKIEWSKKNEFTGDFDPYTDLSASDDRVRSVTTAGTYRVRVSTLNPICFSEKDIDVRERGFNLNDQFGYLVNEATLLKGEKPLCYNGIGSLLFRIELVQPKPATTFEFYLDGTLITLESESLIKNGDGYKLINVAIGQHSLKVKDEFGCESILNFEIENQQEIRLSSSIIEEYIVQKIQCLDEFGSDPKNKAVIDVTGKVMGGVVAQIGQYKYKWTGPSNFSSPNSKIEVAKPGIYDLIILDDNNCKSITYSFTIGAPDAIVITEVYHKNQSCLDETGSLGVSIAGGTPPYTIEWKNDKQEVISTIFEINNLPLGKVSAVVIDSNKCRSGEKEFEIIDERLLIQSIKPDDSVCLGKAGYIEVIISKNNNSTLKFYYDNVEVTALKDTAELYRVIIDNPIFGGEFKITNSFGCSESKIYLFGIANPKIEVQNAEGKILELTDRISENESVLFKNKSVGSYVSEILDFGDGSLPVEIQRGDSDLEKRKHTYVTSGVYTSKMEIFNEEGCSLVEKRLVFVGKAYQLKFPSSFSPNLSKNGLPVGDGINDYFRPIFNGFKSGKMTIYDALGVKLYEESFSNPDFKDTVELNSWLGWDGKNASLENRTYFCVFEGITFEDKTITESNNFYLFK